MADTVAPLLQRTLPADNATGVSVSANLGLAFSEAVRAGSGLIKIYKADGTLFKSIAANDTSQVTVDSAGRVTINPNVNLLAGTSFYVIVEQGAFEDLAGNDYAGLTSTTAFNFTTAGTSGGSSPPLDTTAPLLTGTTPTDNAPDVALNANLILTFNEAVNAGSGNIQIRKSSDGSLVQSISITDVSKVTFDHNRLIINPGSDLSPDTGYYVTLASGVVRDLANNAFAGISSAAVFNFTTQSDYIDTTAPIILFTSPDGFLTGNKNVVITFNEPVRAGSGVIEIRNATDDSLYRTISVTDTNQVSFSGRQVTINPTTDLAPGNYYIVIAPTAFEDLYGHDFDNSFAIGTGTDGGHTGVWNASAQASAQANNTGVWQFASAAATATNIGQLPGQGNTIAGNDASLDVSSIDLDPAINGTLISVTDTRVDIRGTDGLTYRIIGVGFVSGATTVAGIGGEISLVEVWAGAGASAHILYSYYDSLQGLPPPGLFDIGESLQGDDTIIGSSDDDILFGFNGDDLIAGREGNDQLNGGLGYDTFKFTSPDALNGDTIVGFEGGDTIDLSAIDSLSFIGSSAFSGIAGQVRYAWSSGKTLLQIDSDGNGVADASLTLSGGLFALGETTPGSNVLVLTNDTVVPLLVSTLPADNAVGVPVGANFYLTFNENIIAGSGSIEIRRSSDDSVFDIIDVTDSRVTFDGNVASFVPHTPFATQTGYYITFAAGVFQDVAGNDVAAISSKTAFNFTTVDNTAPTLIGRTPAQDAMGVSPGTDIVLTFSEAVQAGSGVIEIRVYGTNALVRSISVTDAAQVGFSGNSLTINPTTDLPFNEHFYLTMAAGVVKDMSGNNYAGIPSGQTHWVNFTTASPPDTTAPKLIASTPSDNEIDVILDANIALVFNEQVKAGTGTIEIRHLSDESLFQSIDVTDATLVSFGDFVVVKPTGTFAPGVGYYVTFGSGVFVDLAGNAAPAVSASTTLNFWTTGSTDIVAPSLSSASPSDNASNVGVGSNIVLTFSETVAPGSGSFVVQKSSDGSYVAIIGSTNSAQAFFEGNSVTLNLPNDLEPGTSYYVLTSGAPVQDTAGNDFAGISSPTALNFTTAGSNGLALMGTSLSNTLTGGTGNDTITGLGRGDTLTGGLGGDKFVYNVVSDSTGKNYDKIVDFNASADTLDLWFQVTGFDPAVTSGSLGTRRFDSDLAFAVGANKLGAYHAVLFTPSTGVLAGNTFLIVDANGTAGYQANADLIILLGSASNLTGFTTLDFV